MAAYVIAAVDVRDPEAYRAYLQAGPPLIPRFGGRVLARTEHPVVLEGPPVAGRWIVIEFPTAAQARAFYESPEYQAARRLREGAAVGSMVLIE